ncbi:c-type cytochrome [Kamptonema formosum]|uniref:c-type cytochrome n=1 Tax=Kamptonema formosum TaxID=331992 RepID=UPI000346B844|nr:cytochrome c [Oscillatoria sp. PCC 10802]
MSEQEKPSRLPGILKAAFKHLWLAVAGVALVAALAFWPLLSNSPVDYADIEDHFKYGSIGSEPVNGIPYWIWKVLPDMFRVNLPGEGGYASLGFLYEPGKTMPVGFSRRKNFIERVGLNCAVCHTGTFRETPESERHLVTAMPANNLNLQGYINFLSAAALDARFNPKDMMPAIEKAGGNLNFIEKLIYRYLAIPRTRDALINQRSAFAFFNRQPEWGVGRVDTFNPYKAVQFHFPMAKLPDSEIIGVADLPSIWNQKPRQGMQLHWDGDNTLVEERNKSAALGAGVTPTSIDLDRIKRVEDWIWELPASSYPYAINEQLASAGERIYQNTCASCHAFGGAQVGKVVPVEDIGTDRHRLDSYTYEMLSNQNTLFAGYPWRFQHFRKTDGYANLPLDGLWLRAPYLHNGSVPTLRDLLEKPDSRPKQFYRGYDVFDQKKVGFVSDVPAENGRNFFKFDTALPGNGNSGHLYGTDLSPEEKDALVEYMKKL